LKLFAALGSVVERSGGVLDGGGEGLRKGSLLPFRVVNNLLRLRCLCGSLKRTKSTGAGKSALALLTIVLSQGREQGRKERRGKRGQEGRREQGREGRKRKQKMVKREKEGD
jgi:hypothetical protein